LPVAKVEILRLKPSPAPHGRYGGRSRDKAQVEIETALKAGVLTDKQADALAIGINN